MRNREILDELLRRMDRMEVALIVRDPGTALSADAYEGLRKQVAMAARDRQAHLVQLALLDETLRSTDDMKAVRSILAEFLEQAGLKMVEDPQRPELYEVVAGDGRELDVLSPAYVDEATDRPIRQGRARALDSARSKVLPTPQGEPQEQESELVESTDDANASKREEASP